MNAIVTILSAILAGAAFGVGMGLIQDGLRKLGACWLVLGVLNAVYVIDALVTIGLA